MSSLRSMKSPAEGAEWHLAYVQTEHIDRNWDWIAPFLKRALERAPCDLTLEGIRERARADNVRIWVVAPSWNPVTGVFVASELDGAVDILVLSGERAREWLPALLPQFCSMARGAGLQVLRMGGRKGWRRFLEPLGFEFRGMSGDRVNMEKSL